MKKRVFFLLALLLVFIQGAVFAEGEVEIPEKNEIEKVENIGDAETPTQEIIKEIKKEEKTTEYKETSEDTVKDVITEEKNKEAVNSEENSKKNPKNIELKSLESEENSEEKAKTEPEEDESLEKKTSVGEEDLNKSEKGSEEEEETEETEQKPEEKEEPEESEQKPEEEEEIEESEQKPEEKPLFNKLVKAIEYAESKVETQILLEGGDYLFENTIKIDNDKKILFSNKDDNVVNFKRKQGFKGTFIEIAEGAKLTLDGDVNDKLVFDGEEKHYSFGREKGRFIYTNGELVINKATFENEHSSGGFYTAPIFAEGKNALIVFNDGIVRNNHSNTSHGGGAFTISNFAKMKFNNGLIENNLIYDQENNYDNLGKRKQSLSPGAGAIFVRDGGKLEMNGGTIKNNYSFAGAISFGQTNPWDYDQDETDPEKLNEYNIAYGRFNGGLITENTGVSDGPGGIFISGSADVEFPEGSTITIRDNIGVRGGGISVSDSLTKGAYNHNMEIAKVGKEIWQKKYPARFVMNGGSIIGNESLTTGGGINVNSNNVTLNKGLVSGNISHSHGGGIYVSSHPYTLYLRNVVITQNRALSKYTDEFIAEEYNVDVTEDDQIGYIKDGKTYVLYKGAGGGIWFCPTGDASIYIDEGGAIFDNYAETRGADFHSEVKEKGYSTVTLPSRLLGGGKILYYEDNKGVRYNPNNPEDMNKLIKNIKFYDGQLSLKAVADELGKETAKELSSLFIVNNEAPRGGGIGSNGSVRIGNPPSEDKPLKEITIKKEWVNVPDKEVEFEIGSKINGKELPFEKIILNKDNNYTVKLTDLPATIAGQALEDVLYVKELTEGNYIFETSEIKHVNDRTETFVSDDKSRSITFNISEYVFTGKNKPEEYEPPKKYGDIIISKEVEGEENSEEEFNFKIILKDKDKKELKELFNYILSKSEEIIKKGKIKSGDTFQLIDGEEIKIKDIPYNTKYEVSEEDTGEYIISSEGEIGTVKSKENYVKFINTKPDEPDEPDEPPEEPEEPDEPDEPPEEPDEPDNPPETPDKPDKPKTPPEEPEIPEEPEEPEEPPTPPEEPEIPEEPEEPEEPPVEPEEPESPPEEPYNPKAAPKTFDQGIRIYILIGLLSVIGFILLKKEYN